MKIYVILENNGYDAYEIVGDIYYTTEQAADEACRQFNQSTGSKRDWFYVEELTPHVEK